MSPPATTTTATTRWCPTSEQLMILEEMYRGGMRTPGAALIQKITAHLSKYGRVEGKNVFYWFQNHKARDRQRLRRKISKQMHHHHQHFFSGHHLLQYLGSLTPPPPATTTPAAASTPFLPLPHLHDPSPFLPHPQVSSVEEAYSSQVKNNNNYYYKHVEASYGDGHGDRTVEMRRYKQKQADLMMTTIVEMPCSGPAKTLELFPLTATNSKEECK